MRRSLGKIAPLLAAAALAAGCGDTLVDHGARTLVALECQPGTATCDVAGTLACEPDDVTRCGATCADCTGTPAPANGVAACLLPATGGQGVCGFECTGGFLRCGDGCCAAAAITAGLWHTCAVTSAGSLVCWGDDQWGQITGDGSREVHAPTVAGPRAAPWSAGVTAATGGQRHTCAVVGGLVRCIGWNDDGQAPALVAGLTGVVALAAGERHTCALTSAGAVTCWGLADRRGGNDGTARFTPLASGASRIAAGRDHTCAVMTSGQVQCWGLNASGQLGDGSIQARLGPVQPQGLGAGISFVAGGHSSTCAAATTPVRIVDNVEDALRCWGSTPGAGYLLAEPQLVPAIPLKDTNSSTIRFTVRDIAVGRAHVCAMGDDGVAGVHCFGPENGSGQLGANTVPLEGEPVPIPNSLGARAIAAGDDHTCAIWADGGVRCWGANATGQLGTGDAAFPGAGVIVTVSGR